MFYKRQNLDAVQLVTYRQTDRQTDGIVYHFQSYR